MSEIDFVVCNFITECILERFSIGDSQCYSALFFSHGNPLWCRANEENSDEIVFIKCVKNVFHDFIWRWLGGEAIIHDISVNVFNLRSLYTLCVPFVPLIVLKYISTRSRWINMFEFRRNRTRVRWHFNFCPITFRRDRTIVSSRRNNKSA